MVKDKIDLLYKDKDKVLPSGLSNQRALTEALCIATHMISSYSESLESFDKRIFVLSNSSPHEAECQNCFCFDNCYDHAHRIGQMGIQLSFVSLDYSTQIKSIWYKSKPADCEQEESDKDGFILLRGLPLNIFEAATAKKVAAKPTRTRQVQSKPTYNVPPQTQRNYRPRQPINPQAQSIVVPPNLDLLSQREINPQHTPNYNYSHMKPTDQQIDSMRSILNFTINMEIGNFSCDFIMVSSTMQDSEENKLIQQWHSKKLSGFEGAHLNELESLMSLEYIKIKINARESGEALEYALQNLFNQGTCLKLRAGPRYILYIRYNGGIEGYIFKLSQPQPIPQQPLIAQHTAQQSYTRRSISPVPTLVNHNSLEYAPVNMGMNIRGSPIMEKYVIKVLVEDV